MGFSLHLVALLLLFSVHTPQSFGSITDTLAKRTSVPNHRFQEATECEATNMAECTDVTMESQVQDSQQTEVMEESQGKMVEEMEQDQQGGGEGGGGGEGEGEGGGGEGEGVKGKLEGEEGRKGGGEGGKDEGVKEMEEEEEGVGGGEGGGEEEEGKGEGGGGGGGGGKEHEGDKEQEEEGGSKEEEEQMEEEEEVKQKETGKKEGEKQTEKGKKKAEPKSGAGEGGKRKKGGKGGKEQDLKKLKQAEEEEDLEPLPPFPDTIEGFGYKFNENGQLRHIETGEPFVFVVKEGDKRFNQAHYEALGEAITEYVYHLLEERGSLKRVNTPVDAKKGEPFSFIFQSDDALTNKDKLLVLIHGSGVVRAGQWARRLIINDCLDSGTQLPFIQKAKEEGYGVMVLNTNRNEVIMDGRKVPIRGSSTPEKHATYVWEHFVKKAKAKEIYIVAHSSGGHVIVHVADVSKFRSDFQKRVKKIAFTDSVHNFALQATSSSVRRWMITHSKNWVSSKDPLDTPQPVPRGEVPCVSAGTTKHEETSYFSMESIFSYFA